MKIEELSFDCSSCVFKKEHLCDGGADAVCSRFSGEMEVEEVLEILNGIEIEKIKNQEKKIKIEKQKQDKAKKIKERKAFYSCKANKEYLAVKEIKNNLHFHKSELDRVKHLIELKNMFSDIANISFSDDGQMQEKIKKEMEVITQLEKELVVAEDRKKLRIKELKKQIENFSK